MDWGTSSRSEGFSSALRSFADEQRAAREMAAEAEAAAEAERLRIAREAALATVVPEVKAKPRRAETHKNPQMDGLSLLVRAAGDKESRDALKMGQLMPDKLWGKSASLHNMCAAHAPCTPNALNRRAGAHTLPHCDSPR
jgi:hypothetical protein